MTKDVLRVDFTSQQNLSTLERQVLAQYQSLALKLYTLSDEIAKLHKSLPIDDKGASGQADALLKNMRGLERKIGLVYTLFRTAVYSLLLQNEANRERERSAAGSAAGDSPSDSYGRQEFGHAKQLESEGESEVASD